MTCATAGLLAALLGAGQGVLACAFHGYTPNPTLVDQLLATEQVVLAQVDPSDPTRYRVSQTLAGPEVPDLALSITPRIRKQLRAQSAERALLARDGAYGPWQELAVLDNRFQSLVAVVMQRQSAWSWGGERDRLRFFAARLNDPNPEIRRLALQELDRVTYAELKTLRLPAVSGLARDLRGAAPELQPIRVLLAGLSGDRAFVPVLSQGLEQAVETELPYLGAYVTAVIELDGKEAVSTLHARYLTQTALPVAQREKILQAFAIQRRSAPRATRRAIARSLSDLSRSNPELHAAITRYFGDRSRWNRGN